MIVRAIWEFDVNDSEMDEKFVDKKGLCEDLTKRELDYCLKHNQLNAEDFIYEAHPGLPSDWDSNMDEYILTEKGRKECEIFIAELKAKRKEILDAGIDTANETFVDYTPEELFDDLLDFGIDEDG